MATTFSEAKTGLDDIARAIRNSRALINQARENPTAVKNSLDSLSSQSATLIADIEAAATASPNNVALQNLKAELDLLVAEFQTNRAEAAALETAVQGV